MEYALRLRSSARLYSIRRRLASAKSRTAAPTYPVPRQRHRFDRIRSYARGSLERISADSDFPQSAIRNPQFLDGPPRRKSRAVCHRRHFGTASWHACRSAPGATLRAFFRLPKPRAASPFTLSPPHSARAHLGLSRHQHRESYRRRNRQNTNRRKIRAGASGRWSSCCHSQSRL